LPDDVREIYDEERYAKFQEYEKAKYKFSNISDTFDFITIVLVLIF
jgi:Zn-finger nucleic acid-binding protein